VKALIEIAIVFLLVVPWTQNGCARGCGGNSRMDLKPGLKLVNITWKGADVWALTRPMQDGERAETYTFGESSNWGFFEGSIKVVEHGR
jgi:hypothetical protein